MFTVFFAGSQQTRNTGLALTLQQYRAVLQKRLTNLWRSPFVNFFQVVIPVLTALLGVLPKLIDKTDGDFNENETKRTFTLSSYDHPVAPYTCKYSIFEVYTPMIIM